MSKKVLTNDELREFLLELGSVVPDKKWHRLLRDRFNEIMRCLK